MKGRINESELRERIAYIHGRIEREIEAFAASLALPAVALTTRLGALLLGVEAGDVHRLSHVQLEAGSGGGTLAEVEGASQPHGGGAQPRGQLASGPATGKAAKNKVSKLTQAQRSYWADKTPEERSREMRRRMRKWKPEAKAKFLKKKKIAKTPPKQLVYAQRHAAKKRGLPLPPLPPPSGEKAA